MLAGNKYGTKEKVTKIINDLQITIKIKQLRIKKFYQNSRKYIFLGVTLSIILFLLELYIIIFEVNFHRDFYSGLSNLILKFLFYLINGILFGIVLYVLVSGLKYLFGIIRT